MSIGLKSKTVVLEPHQVEWEEEGRRKCAEIKESLGRVMQWMFSMWAVPPSSE